MEFLQLCQGGVCIPPCGFPPPSPSTCTERPAHAGGGLDPAATSLPLPRSHTSRQHHSSYSRSCFGGGNVRSSLKPSSPYHFLREIPLNSNRHLGTEASCGRKGFCIPELSRSPKTQSPAFPRLLAYLLRREMEYTESAARTSCNWALATSFPTALKVSRFLILSLQIIPLC